MRDISAVVDQMRAVRRAQKKFMGLWAMEQAIILPALDRVAADVDAVAMPSGTDNFLSLFNDCAADDDD